VPHEWLPATAEAAERVGAAAAAIHHRRYERGGFLESSLVVAQSIASVLRALHGWADPMLAGRAGERLGALGDAVRAAWANERDEMAAAAAPVLVHADFKPMNIGWMPDVGDVVVFDWEFAWIGPALFDLGQLLRWNPPVEFVDGVERGYRAAGGLLPVGWQRLAELFDLFNLIGFLDHPRACERRIADVLERVQQTVC
jgi:aminoglycoside phosphotransferase (APT) family kinase protein